LNFNRHIDEVPVLAKDGRSIEYDDISGVLGVNTHHEASIGMVDKAT